MQKQQYLEHKLSEALAPSFLTIENESHKHSSGRGSDSHFKLIIVAESFIGQSKLNRHRKIYQLLEKELVNGIHALALHTYTPEEWENIHQTVPMSPNCLGHGK